MYIYIYIYMQLYAYNVSAPSEGMVPRCSQGDGVGWVLEGASGWQGWRGGRQFC